MTGPTAQQLFDGLGDQLTAADWTWSSGRTFRRADRAMALGHGEIDLDEVTDHGPVELLHTVVSTVEQAAGVLRALGYLPAAEPEYEPALVYGTCEVWVHTCGHVEVWAPGEADTYEWACEPCESGKQVEWRQLYVRRAPATDPGWSRRPDGPAVQR